MGYHEGTRRTVRCDQGYLTGFDVYYRMDGSYRNAIISGMRLYCSRWVLHSLEAQLVCRNGRSGGSETYPNFTENQPGSSM